MFYLSFSSDILKSYSEKYYSPESDPPHKIMSDFLITQSGWVFHFEITESVIYK